MALKERMHPKKISLTVNLCALFFRQLSIFSSISPEALVIVQRKLYYQIQKIIILVNVRESKCVHRLKL